MTDANQELRLRGDASPDSDDRVRDFLARHGGASRRASRAVDLAPGVRGFSETYAADGYTLRCEWSNFGSREEMKYSEIAPPRPTEGAP